VKIIFFEDAKTNTIVRDAPVSRTKATSVSGIYWVTPLVKHIGVFLSYKVIHLIVLSTILRTTPPSMLLYKNSQKVSLSHSKQTYSPKATLDWGFKRA